MTSVLPGTQVRRPDVSVVFPVFNEESNLEPLYTEVTAVLAQTEATYELLFVDNGSTDRSLEILKSLTNQDGRVRYLSLSRNFGHQGGLFAGLCYCRGAAAITMDADLQHPPQLLPEMIRLWREGYDVVYTMKRNSPHLSPLRLRQFQLFYWLLSKLSGLKLSFGQSDFRLLDRRVIDVLVRIPEYRKFLRGLVQWMGFKQMGLEYDVGRRYGGRSKFSVRALLSFAVDGILAYSALPLRWSFALGAATAAVSLLYAMFILVLGVLRLMGRQPDLPPGWVTITVAIMFLASVQLLAIGVLSEYVGRLYEQVKGRPPFIVREASERSGDEA